MNAKFDFISNEKIVDPVEVKLSSLQSFEKIATLVDEHLNLQNRLKNTFNDLAIIPEFFVKEESENVFKIYSRSDMVCLVELNDKNLALNIVTLMNLACREGAKQMINLIKIEGI